MCWLCHVRSAQLAVVEGEPSVSANQAPSISPMDHRPVAASSADHALQLTAAGRLSAESRIVASVETSSNDQADARTGRHENASEAAFTAAADGRVAS